MANSKNNKKNNHSIKKITELSFKFDLKSLFIIFFLGLFSYYIFTSLSKEVKQALPEKSITTIVKEIKEGKIEKVEIINNKIIVYYKNDKLAITHKEQADSFLKTLKDADVDTSSLNITVKDTEGSAGIINFLSNIIPTILMVAFFIFLFRQAKGAQESVFSFGQSRAKRFNKDIKDQSRRHG